MKIAKQPKRWGKPSAKFLATKGQPAVETKEPDKFEEETSEEPVTGLVGGVKIFLDDERDCPPGWTLVRTPFDFFKLLREGGDEFLSSVTEIALDWYLGSHHVNGVEVAKELAYNFFAATMNDEPPYMPNLKRMYFHSSDRDQARRMANIFNDTFEAEEVNRTGIRLRLGAPV